MKKWALAAIGGLLVTLAQPASAAIGDKDCSDFSSQREAQLFYLNNNPSADPHRLDAEGDGIVCESLPAPYYYGSDPTPGGSKPPAKPQAPAPVRLVRVLEGDLLKVRQGTKPAFTVRLLGAVVPRNNACYRNGARADLRAWIKPGQVVQLIKDKRAPKRDANGVPIFNVADKDGYTIGGTQVAYGWASVGSYRFSDKAKYSRWSNEADFERLGNFAECVTNYGTPRHPYATSRTFDLGPWRYEFGATDTDASPEMTLDPVAASQLPAPRGWTFVRVPVTIRRIGDGGGYADIESFTYRRGDQTFYQWTDSDIADCSPGTGYLSRKWLNRGEAFSGFVCATIRGAAQSADQWQVDSAIDAGDHTDELYVNRRVKVS